LSRTEIDDIWKLVAAVTPASFAAQFKQDRLQHELQSLIESELSLPDARTELTLPGAEPSRLKRDGAIAG
jgi:hypothetical protein